MEFNQFKPLFQKHFEEMIENAAALYQVNVDKEVLWNTYLDSFPAGKNEIYRTRREFDCSCCRHFFRDFGNVVVIKDQKITTLWDFHPNDDTFEPVMQALNAFILAHPVTEQFFSKFANIGTDQNRELTDDGVTTWDHFYIKLPARFVDKSSRSIPELMGQARDTRNVFKRSMDEITMDAVDTVLELIQSNTLYRGSEWKEALKQFKQHKTAYDKLPEEKKALYAWEMAPNVGPVIGRIRNHSIGVLLTNISENMELDAAVREYERIVAPANYKRPNAIFTKKMLEDAKKTITDLGYMESLPRRHATLDDITVNNILFSNRDAAKRITGADIFDDMASGLAIDPKKFSRAEEISIEKFISDVLPNAREVEAFVENRHAKNMVSLIAPQNANAKSMFKWGNAFSWAYSGNLADSDITERVRAAGGRTDGVLRFSHSWNYEGMRNASLMDLHVFMPGSNQTVEMKGGKEIHNNYGNNERVGWNHRQHTSSGGIQDVDYTPAAPVGYIPVENTTFPSMNRLKDGVYTFKIHNWSLRQPTQGGFKAELAFNGEVYQFEHRKPLANKEWVTVAKLEKKNGAFRILEMMNSNVSPINLWGIQTQQFVPVSVVMLSPNYWDEQTGNGNKHYFFMLKDCVNPEEPNGFYNEYLKSDLLQHKRVLEALGGKMAVGKVEDQLSGIGFSSTVRNELIVKVKGATERVMKIKF